MNDLYTHNISPDFDLVAARERAAHLKAVMPRNLFVATCNPAWASEWDLMIGQTPDAFYETLSRGIQGEVSVYFNFFENDDSNFDVRVRESGRTVFESENKIFHDGRGKFLYFKEWTNKDIESGRRGIGLNLFSNIFDVAIRGGLDAIALRGGRSDGRFFWPAHGFYFRDTYHVQRAIPQIAQKLVQHSDTIPDGIQKEAHDILAQGGKDLCWKVARLPGSLDVKGVVKPLGWVLLNIDHEAEYEIDLHDARQVERVRASLAHLQIPSLKSDHICPPVPVVI